MARSDTLPGTEVDVTCLADPGGGFTRIGYRACETIVSRGIIQATCQTAREDFAEALILGCTLEIGFYREVGKAVDVPVIAPFIAGMKRAGYAANLERQCGWVPSRIRFREPPPEDETPLFSGFDNGDGFARRLVIEAK